LRSDAVWTPAFLRAEGFDEQWSIRYLVLVGAAGIFLFVLGFLGAL
jgi:hypothetical protein